MPTGETGASMPTEPSLTRVGVTRARAAWTRTSWVDVAAAGDDLRRDERDLRLAARTSVWTAFTSGEPSELLAEDVEAGLVRLDRPGEVYGAVALGGERGLPGRGVRAADHRARRRTGRRASPGPSPPCCRGPSRVTLSVERRAGAGDLRSWPASTASARSARASSPRSAAQGAVNAGVRGRRPRSTPDRCSSRPS